MGLAADILRKRGVEVGALPQIKYPSNPSWSWFFKTIPKYLKPRRRLKWKPLQQGKPFDAKSGPPPAVAWHIFDEATTLKMRQFCRANKFTVNSFLLAHLTSAIRPFLENQSAEVPWMIPVNLRGKVTRERDSADHTSYVGVKVRAGQAVKDVHESIYAALASGEHWANWYCYTAAHSLSMGMKKYLLEKDKVLSEWFLGGFSNPGEWDPERKIKQSDCQGGWLFSPPVLRFQMVGVGVVTFQGRLSLTIQTHPDLTTDPGVPRNWMNTWVKSIENDLAKSSP
jgi:NRPS condensation-like uncharacterized protein